MSLAANVIYHEERAHHFTRMAILISTRPVVGDNVEPARAYALRKMGAHTAAWRELVLSQAGEG